MRVRQNAVLVEPRLPQNRFVRTQPRENQGLFTGKAVRFLKKLEQIFCFMALTA